MIKIRPILFYCHTYRMETPVGFVQINPELSIMIEENFAIPLHRGSFVKQLNNAGFRLGSEVESLEDDVGKCVLIRGMINVLQ